MRTESGIVEMYERVDRVWDCVSVRINEHNLASRECVYVRIDFKIV